MTSFVRPVSASVKVVGLLGALVALTCLAFLALASSAGAQGTPDDPVCALNHITGDECQGPDYGLPDKLPGVVSGVVQSVLDGEVPPVPDLERNRCRIGVWVGKVSCSGLLPPDGDGNIINAGIAAWNDAGETATITLRVIDEVTGQVLFEKSASSTDTVQTPVGNATRVTNGVQAFYGNSFDHPVTLEAEGTHAELGAQTAAFSATDVQAFDVLGVVPLVPNNAVVMAID